MFKCIEFFYCKRCQMFTLFLFVGFFVCFIYFGDHTCCAQGPLLAGLVGPCVMLGIKPKASALPMKGSLQSTNLFLRTRDTVIFKSHNAINDNYKMWKWEMFPMEDI